MRRNEVSLYASPTSSANHPRTQLTNRFHLCSLARAELNLTLATVFRRFDNQQLFKSSRLDVDVKHDFFLPQQDKKSKGVKVLFK